MNILTLVCKSLSSADTYPFFILDLLPTPKTCEEPDEDQPPAGSSKRTVLGQAAWGYEPFSW